MTKGSFTIKEYKIKECLKLVHTNMCETFNIHARGRYEYFITFTLLMITLGLDMFT